MTESRAKFHKISNKNIHLKTNELICYKFWTRIDVAVTPFFYTIIYFSSPIYQKVPRSVLNRLSIDRNLRDLFLAKLVVWISVNIFWRLITG